VSVPAPTTGRLLGNWSIDPLPLAALTFAAALYLIGMRRARGRWTAWRAASFLGGLVALAAALMSGIDTYAERLLSVHMLQHLILMLLAPALLLAGAPLRLALAAGSPSARRALAALLRAPPARAAIRLPVSFALLAGVVLLTHLTGLYELALRDRGVHALEHAAYLLAGLLFLAPLIAAEPLARPPGAIQRFAWAMAAMTVMAVPGALLTLSESVRYRHYLAPAHALGRSALADQHVAGVIMWIGGGAVMLALALTLALTAMLAEERRQRRRDAYARSAT
jgi:putative membrane protein